MTVLDQLLKLSSAEDFFIYLNVPFDPAVLNVARLHILKRMGEYLRAEAPDADQAKAHAYFRAQLERAYLDFVNSSPLVERVFKAHKNAQRRGGASLVHLSDFTG